MLEGDPDGVAPPGKITKEEKERLRGLQMSFVKRMYEHAKEFLGRGLERAEGNTDPLVYWAHFGEGATGYRAATLAVSRFEADGVPTMTPFIGSDLGKRDKNRILT